MKEPCDKECRIRHSGGQTTMAYYPPIYDKYGRNTNPDMNVTTSTAHCVTCGKNWSVMEQCGNTVWTPIEGGTAWHSIGVVE